MAVLTDKQQRFLDVYLGAEPPDTTRGQAAPLLPALKDCAPQFRETLSASLARHPLMMVKAKELAGIQRK